MASGQVSRTNRPTNSATSVANLAPRLVDDNLDLSEAYVKDDARVARTVSIA